MTIIERRATPRANVAYQIAYECFNRDGAKIGKGAAHTVNLSGRGALIEMEHAVDADTSMILWILAPFYTMLAKGSVVHSHAAENGLFRVGMRLTDVIEGSWDVLERDVKARLEEIPE